jgi:hypothetical protein
MKLVSMKLDKSEQKKESEPLAYEKPLYPWGLSIELNDDALSKLGIKKLPDVDERMTLTARVCITSVSARANADGEAKSMSLQIEALALSDVVDDDEQKDPADALYKK